MKTKKNSFSKIITFCVLSLFLITNMILFTSCDNGNSSNDNTNEEQNNNAPTDYCKICDGTQEKPCGILHVCDDEECLDHNEEAQKNGHIHDYCNEQECADKKVTDKDHQHDYCKEPGCDDIDGKEHGHCTDEDCDHFGKIYDDYAKEHGTNHTYSVEDQCNICDGLQTDPCGIKHTCDDEKCVNYNEGKTYKEGHQHDYCNEQDCANVIVSDRDHVHDYCNIGDCANITVTDKNHVHNYCDDDANCLGKDKTSPDHEHDYCNDCEGNQTDPNHTCLIVEEPTLSAEVKSIGNGTYSIANFMVNDNAEDSIDKKVADGLECAEKYIKGFAGCFENTANNQNLQNLVNVLGTESTYNTNNTTGFDPIINKLNNACAPIFEEIIEKIDTPLDRYSFICYYNALSNEAYKHGSGDYFNGNQTQEDTYNDKKEQIQRDFADNYAFEGEDTPFDIVDDIENNNCKEITNRMKNLLTNSNVANDMGITETDLDNLIDFSTNIRSLNAMHDYSASKKLSTHASCVISGNTLENVMLEKTVELDNAGMAMLNNKNNIQDRELC